MIPRILSALVDDEVLRQKREEVEEEYRRLESQIPEAIQRSLQLRFPDEDARILMEKHAGLTQAVERDLRAYYRSSRQRKQATLSHLLATDTLGVV
jgi:DNA polymerase I-like protein with 3'-5' exonuclease and polymerase domains